MILLRDSTLGRSSFVLSSIMPWTDDRLLTCLVGLSFIAIDETSWDHSLFDMLCPESDHADERPSERFFVLPARFKHAAENERTDQYRRIVQRAQNGAGLYQNVAPQGGEAGGEEDIPPNGNADNLDAGGDAGSDAGSASGESEADSASASEYVESEAGNRTEDSD